MVIISEWLPNPAGSDATGEWIELFNRGPDAVNISGWSVKTRGGSHYTISAGYVGAGKYFLLPRTTTKVTLRNTDETLSLFDSSGVLRDTSGFLGTAPEGKSYSRFGDTFAFAIPSEGLPNKQDPALALVGSTPQGTSLSVPVLTAGEVPLLALAVGCIFAVAMILLIHRHHALSELFFKRN